MWRWMSASAPSGAPREAWCSPPGLRRRARRRRSCSCTRSSSRCPTPSCAPADVLRLEAGGAPYSWGAARLFGSAAVCPAQTWEAGDGFHVNLAFTFTPAAAETAASDIPGGSEFDSALVLPPEQSAEPAPVAPPDPVIVPPDPVVVPPDSVVVPPDPVVVPPEAPVPPDLPAVPDQAPEAEGDEEPEAPPVPETGDVAGPTE